MSEGVSNFQIEEAFKNIRDKDINNSFVGGFPSNYMNKFTDHKIMISEKKKRESIHFSQLIQTALAKRELTDGVYLILSQKQTFFLFGLDSLKTFIIQGNKKVIEKNFI